MQNFNKLYEIKEIEGVKEIVKKEKAKKSTTKAEKETNENDEVSLLEKTVSKILELNYFELKPQDIQKNMDLKIDAI